jgi:hypothetical protein
MAQHRRTARIAAHRRTVGGKVYQVRKHSRTVTYGSRKRNGKGWFQLKRSWRHLRAQPAKGKRKRKWSKKKKAAMVGLGVAEILGWVLLRTTGGIFAIVTIVFSGLSLMLASGVYGKMSTPAIRKPPMKKVADD